MSKPLTPYRRFQSECSSSSKATSTLGGDGTATSAAAAVGADMPGLAAYTSKDLWDVAVALGIKGCRGKTSKAVTIQRISLQAPSAVAQGVCPRPYYMCRLWRKCVPKRSACTSVARGCLREPIPHVAHGSTHTVATLLRQGKGTRVPASAAGYDVPRWRYGGCCAVHLGGMFSRAREHAHAWACVKRERGPPPCALVYVVRDPCLCCLPFAVALQQSKLVGSRP